MAQPSELYVVTRSTKTFKIRSESNPVIGLFRTRDRGQTWEHFGWEAAKCFSVAVDTSRTPPVWYLACGNGVHKSSDGGKTWAILTGREMTECLKVAIDRLHPDTLYVATAYGIFKSVDGGRSWEEKNLGLTSTFTSTVLIDAREPGVLYCATEAGIHRSRDGGELWEPAGLLGLAVRTLIQHPSRPEIFLAGTENDGVFVSHDGGKTWVAHNRGLAHRTVYALAASKSDPDLFLAGTFRGGVYKSTDGGRTWHPANTNLTNLDIHALTIDPTDARVMYAGTLNDGVWMSTDGAKTWRFIGLETSQVWDMVIYE